MLQGDWPALAGPGGFGSMHWALFAVGWAVALLGVAFVPAGARVPFVLVLLSPIGWIGLAWFGVERLVSRVGKTGGIIGLVLGLLLLLLSALMSLDAGFGSGMRAADDVFQFWPAAGVAIAILALPLFLLPWHLVWVVFRAAITMLRLSPRERLLLRDSPPGKASVARLVTRMWGMPPTLAFARRPRGRYALIITLAVLAAFFFAVAGLFIILSNASCRMPRCGSSTASGTAARTGRTSFRTPNVCVRLFPGF